MTPSEHCAVVEVEQSSNSADEKVVNEMLKREATTLCSAAQTFFDDFEY